MNREYIERALEELNEVLSPAVDLNSDADVRLQGVRNDLEMGLEGEPLSVEPDEDEEYEPEMDPALEGEEAEGGPPEGIMSSYTGA